MVSRSQHGPCWIIILAVIVVLMPAISRAQPTPPQKQTDQPAPPQFKETIEVVGATPIHGLGIQRNKIPNNVQAATAADLARTPGVDTGPRTLRIKSLFIK
jgi:hypothetical protein